LTYYAFCNELMRAFGIGPLPRDAFVRRDPPRFLGDWVDTEESQKLLRYQTRGLDDLRRDTQQDVGALAPLIRLLRPLINTFVIRSSPYWKQNRRRGA
jgi:hypothetical protein